MTKYMTAIVTGVYTIALFSVCTFSACSKYDEYCLSEVTKARHANDICPTKCDYVMGCDAKQYCNLCEANKAGVVFLK